MATHSMQEVKFEEGARTFQIVDLARADYKIHIAEGVLFEITGKPPNWFHRKMMKLFFGWDIEILDRRP